MTMKTMAALAFALSAFLLASCKTYYTEEAAEKARAFALEHTRGLTEHQRNYIRYTLPSIQQRVIFEYTPMPLTEYDHIPRNKSYKPKKSKRLDFIDMYFVWDIPGLPCSVVVAGSGESSGNFWRPLKVIYKTLAPADSDYEAARTAAVEFVINNMLDLSDAERDRVRFSEAEVCGTFFDLSYILGDEKLPESGWESYLSDLKGGRKKNIQYSLVWHCDSKDRVIVITGMGTGASLAGWTPLSSKVIERKLLDKYLSPEEYESPSDKGKLKPVAPADRTVKTLSRKELPPSGGKEADAK